MVSFLPATARALSHGPTWPVLSKSECTIGTARCHCICARLLASCHALALPAPPKNTTKSGAPTSAHPTCFAARSAHRLPKRAPPPPSSTMSMASPWLHQSTTSASLILARSTKSAIRAQKEPQPHLRTSNNSTRQTCRKAASFGQDQQCSTSTREQHSESTAARKAAMRADSPWCIAAARLSQQPPFALHMYPSRHMQYAHRSERL